MCGTGHSTMRAEVIVMTQDEFDEWMRQQKTVTRPRQKDGDKTHYEDRPLRATMVEMGRRLSESAGCFKCHSVDGSPHIGPTWLDMYRRGETMRDGSTIGAGAGGITESVMEPKR